jgi:phosphatidylglycerophosphate synthase
MKTSVIAVGPTVAPAGPTWSRSAFLATWVRIPLGIFVLGCLVAGRDALGTVILTLFVILDVVDGAIARAGDADNSYRRGLDSIVDRLAVTAFFIVAALQSSAIWPAASVIVTVNLAALPFGVLTWQRSRVVLKAPAWHRSWSLTLFLAGLLYLNDNAGLAGVTAIAGALTMAACTIELVCTHLSLGRRRVMLGSD